MSMTLSHNPYAFARRYEATTVPSGFRFRGPRFSWKARMAVIAIIVFITTIGGAFRITLGDAHTPSYTDTKLARQSGVVLQDSYQSSVRIKEWEPNTLLLRLNNVRTASERVLVNVEVFDAANQRVVQRYWNNVLIPQGKNGQCLRCVALTLDTPGLMAGTYTVDVGIFRPNWKGLIRWYDGIQTFTVEANQTPALGTLR